MFLPYLLGHPDSNKEINEICISLAVMCPFFLWLLLDFLFTASLNFDVLWCHLLHISCGFGSLSFLDMWVYSFCYIYNILVIISSSTFSVTSLFWVSNHTMSDCLILPHRLWMHCSFFKKNPFISILHFEYFLSL